MTNMEPLSQAEQERLDAAEQREAHTAALSAEWTSIGQQSTSMAQRYGWDRIHQRYASVAAELTRLGPPEGMDLEAPYPLCRCEQCAPAADQGGGRRRHP